ncbi:hypothetical protein CAI21_19060 [Alkalilimnicola ehrlichii]|uniref:Methyl-accepting chemotaxis protein n=1 Tax=Alkalilimnicola ehrlichii TaxID=351052 RepID=A0A3E0WI08_9GAMM|nr:methyl-accepting chemotaxis protein [Alkalilimnicola ehrlichii]RFA25536.1 hypothetical protein CAI21_19060 [Alkalilimnicola ehrlichii]RFA32610.1 hypothetical protein CAL65_19250 [Alkalilimnicola ehrlichii]
MFHIISSSIRNKLLLITGGGTALVLVAVAFGFLELRGSLNHYGQLVDRDLHTLSLIADLDDSFNAQLAAWNVLLITAEDETGLATAWRRLQNEHEAVRNALADATQGLEDPQLRVQLETFASGHTELREGYRAALEAFRQSGYRAHVGYQVLAEQHEELSGILFPIEQTIADQIAHDSAAATARAGRASMQSILFVALAVTVGFFVFITMVQRSILRPTQALVGDLRRLAGGDFSQPVARTTHDELGQIAESAEQLQTKLGGMLSEIGSAVAQMASAAEEMATVSEQTSEGMSIQQRETSQAAAAMNQLSTTVQEVARNTADAAQAAEEADREAQDGRRVVEATVDGITVLAEEVEKAAEAIQRLEQDSSDIGTVLSVIHGVADQTNLLALNAAIEAARAGDQGRGFAVVADEVRALAQRTQESTQEINDMIERLQTGTKKTVEAMAAGRDRARETVDQAEHAYKALSAITRAVSTIKEMSTHIASASEEQGAVAAEMDRNIIAINDVAERSAEGAGQTSRSSEELAGLAEQLSQLVSRFKIS